MSILPVLNENIRIQESDVLRGAASGAAMLRHKSKHHKKESHDKETGETFSYKNLEGSAKSDHISDSDITQSMSLTDSQATASWSSEEKKVFEDQMESLQDQLIAAMMQNQKLGNVTVPAEFSCFIFS